MSTIEVNGRTVQADAGEMLLAVLRREGISVPTLCHMEGLSPYGACRLCVVEIGEGPKARLVASCTYPVEQGIKVRRGEDQRAAFFGHAADLGDRFLRVRQMLHDVFNDNDVK